MRDYILPPADIEAAAQLLDPEAWRSSDSPAGAFELRYRRYRAREAAGWPNDLHPPKLAPKGLTATDRRGVVPGAHTLEPPPSPVSL
jgi:hypothetical protein